MWTPQSAKIYTMFQVSWHIQGTQTEINYIMTFSTGGFWNVLLKKILNSQKRLHKPCEDSKQTFTNLINIVTRGCSKN